MQSGFIARGWLLKWCIVLIAVGAPVRLFSAEPPEPATHPAAGEEADPAEKKLIAAQGLFQRGLYRLATEEYADFLSRYPKHPQYSSALYALAICQYRQNEHAKAAVLLNAALADERFAQRGEALAVLGHCELVQKHHEKAIAAFDELLSKYPDSKHVEQTVLYRAQALYAAGKFDQAAAACEQFIQKYAKSQRLASALFSLARSQQAAGRADAAKPALDRLIREYPDWPGRADAMLLLGQILDASGRPADAVEQYRRLLSAAPDDRKPEARYSLGVALIRAGQFDEAVEQLSAAAGAEGSAISKPARLQLGTALLAAGKTADARATFEAVIQADAARAAEAEYGLAQCDMAEKQFAPARERLARLAARQPPPANLAQIALDRANCLMRQDQFEQAAGEFESIEKTYPQAEQVPEAIYRRAYCLHKLSKYAESRAVCDQLTKGGDGFAAAARELGAENLFLSAKYADAANEFESLAKTTSDSRRQLWFTLRFGQCAYYAKDYKAAAERLSLVAADEMAAKAGELQPAIFLLGDSLLQLGKNAEAAESLNKFITVAKGDTAEAQFRLAMAKLKSNDVDAAQELLATLSQGPIKSPWVRRALVELGQLLYKAAKPDRAAECLEKVAAADAPAELAAPATYLLGWIDYDAKRYAAAAKRWEQLVAKYPAHPLAADAALQQGSALKEAGKLDEAVAVLKTYISAHADASNSAAARQLLAACLSAQGKSADALSILTVLSSGPSSNDAVLYDLAWAQRRANDVDSAIAAYQRLLRDCPQSKLLAAAQAEWAELIYDKQRYAEAAELLEAVAHNPGASAEILSAASYRLGLCYQKLGKLDKAAGAFDSASKHLTDPDAAASAGFQAGLAFAQEGKFDKAEQSIAEMLKKYPAAREANLAMLRLGEVQAERGEYSESQKTYLDFLHRLPTDKLASRAQFGIGWALENQKKFDDARKAYEKAIAATNGETAARAQFQIGETYLAEAKFEQAIPALLAVEDVYAYPKWSARALLEAGRAFEQLKQLDHAKQQYQQLIGKYKDTPEASLAQERLKALT